MKSFTQLNLCLPPPPLSSLPRAPQLSPRRADCVQMLASLQNVLPSSVLASISNNPAAKNQPQQDAGDVGDRDNYPSSSDNNRAMSVDEQGIKKKKGRSNEVSFPSPPSPVRKRHKHGCAFCILALSNPLSVTIICASHLLGLQTSYDSIALHRHSSSSDHRPQSQTTRLTFKYNSYHPVLVTKTDRPHPAVQPIH